MKPWLIIINDFCHDLFTGIWFGSFIILAIFQQRLEHITDSGQLALMAELAGLFTWLCLGSLVLIAATGGYRATYFRKWDSSEMVAVKNRLLIIKHALLGSSFLIGTAIVIWWAF